ncbi:NADPH-dependent F420 reductase [Brevundimonas sp. SORGH_AS_0993]|uniref:NADPH-dependent F420 reductase n=1 Tax=Brevundimonas sp. SORGH_AS_0993 TaxID=3041794 RepID=UPI0027D86DF0|nr:NAD(P)-binding domain-containing protein [Brevundimonas sp. SORGH_AS_0993]
MKLGVIGAGVVGRAVGGLAVRAGHEVMLSNSRGPETLFSLRYGLGCQVGTAEEAAAFGEVVLIAVPLSAYRSVPVAPLAGKIVIDANNYYPERDGRISALDSGEATTSGLLADHLPVSRIVKAFNAVTMHDLERDGRPTGSDGRRALPLSGDDAPAKAVVAGLYDQFGFDALDAGALNEGWRFERGTPAYCTPFTLSELEAVLAKTRRA